MKTASPSVAAASPRRLHPRPRSNALEESPDRRRRRVLFFVEGFTDIRFVTGLSQICDLTMVVPAQQYADSGLKDRVNALNLPVTVREIPANVSRFNYARWSTFGDA